MRLSPILFAALCLWPIGAQAEPAKNCTLIVDLGSAKTLHESGDCQARHGAQSTFKIPLAVMGFDSGILEDAHNPVWHFEEGFTLNRDADKQPTDPTYWEAESVVWFSQKLTTLLGLNRFQHYITQFDYGNKDISGNPGQHDGLTRSWLSSSLQISPMEQIAFLKKLKARSLGVQDSAYDKTMAIIPAFAAGEWAVQGKTGTGFHRRADGTKDRDLQEGWFVGWANKGDRTVLFAAFMADDKKEDSYAGPRTRDKFLNDLPQLMKDKP